MTEIMTKAEIIKRREEALKIRYPLFLIARQRLNDQPVPLTDQTKMYIPGVGVIP